MAAPASTKPTARNPVVEAPIGPMGDLKLGDEPSTNGHEDPLVEKRRRYSLDLYQYTNDQWQGVRKAIEESSRKHATVDNSDSRTDSSSSGSSAESLPDKAEAAAERAPSSSTVAAV